MNELCQMDCCSKCGMMGAVCGGCEQTDGHPCGGTCAAAECVRKGGAEELSVQKKEIIEEVNALGIRNLQITELHLLMGSYVNLEYSLPNGEKIRLLENNRVYWGNQVERPDSERCYGIAADESRLLVCEYGCGGSDPEIVLYKRRKQEV